VRALDAITREVEDAATQRRELQRVLQDLQIAVANTPGRLHVLLEQHDARSEARTGRAMEALEQLASTEASRQKAEIEQAERLSTAQMEQARRLQDLEIEERRRRMARWNDVVAVWRDALLVMVRDPWIRAVIVALVLNGLGISVYQVQKILELSGGVQP